MRLVYFDLFMQMRFRILGKIYNNLIIMLLLVHLQLSVLQENMTVEIKQIECLVPWLYISQFRTNFLNFCGLHYVSLAKKEFQPLYLKLMLITSIVHAL